jgi:hypothetical protein
MIEHSDSNKHSAKENGTFSQNEKVHARFLLPTHHVTNSILCLLIGSYKYTKADHLYAKKKEDAL